MTRREFIRLKARGKKWTMLTAYDAPTAELLEQAGIDLILVGDSLGMVVLGYPSTLPVTMDEMIHHARAVRRGAKKAFVIGDMPFEGLKNGPRQALESAKRFMREAGCNAVKLEWNARGLETARLLIRHRIPVMGHIGLAPQTAFQRGVFRAQGQDAEDGWKILENARMLEREGAFSLVLECVTAPVAKAITQEVRIPAIGIGSGPFCDGQVLVFHDLTGIYKKLAPRFVKPYADLDDVMARAVRRYRRDVTTGRFPQRKHSFGMKKEELEKFIQRIKTDER